MGADANRPRRRITLFDASLGEGGFGAGAALSLSEKLDMAAQISRLGVDGIVAGFPMASPGDFAAAAAIARLSRTWDRCPVIAALARPIAADVDTCWRAIEAAARPRITVLCATAGLGLDDGSPRDGADMIRHVAAAMARARGYCGDVQLSVQDAFRADREFLREVIEAALVAGVNTITLIDSTGYALPAEIGARVKEIVAAYGTRASIGIHAHDDLGLATAAALAAVEAGADQVECTLTGIGERAGNTALEELVMVLHSRRQLLPFDTGVERGELYRTAKLISTLAGNGLPVHKAIVGAQAYHEFGTAAGADALGRAESDPDVLVPGAVGRPVGGAVLGDNLSAAAVGGALAALGIHLASDQMAAVHAAYLDLAERKQAVTIDDLEAITGGLLVGGPAAFVLRDFVITTGRAIKPSATVRLAFQLEGDRELEATATGDGPVDAMYHAVDRLTAIPVTLLDYALTAATSGKDALGQVAVKLEYKGHIFTGRGVSTDVLAASLHAYIHALNKIAAARGRAGDFGASQL